MVKIVTQIYFFLFWNKKKNGQKDTVMFSMVEMPKVIFSPDSAGMRKTNLREGGSKIVCIQLGAFQKLSKFTQRSMHV